MICSKSGVLSTGTIALGILPVSGRSLVASPPTRITAFITLRLCSWLLIVFRLDCFRFYHKLTSL